MVYCDPKEFPVQNLAQEPEPTAVRLTEVWEDETQMSARRVNSLPPQQSITTAIVHQEQSPWSSTSVAKDATSFEVVDRMNMPSRARSMNVRTGSGKPIKTDVRVSDDSNVKYSWMESIGETTAATRLGVERNDDVSGKPDFSSLVATAAAAVI